MFFFDVETTWDFERNDVGELTFVGAFDSETREYFSFWNKSEDLKLLQSRLESADRVVGYNSWYFDYGVLDNYLDLNLKSLPSLDLMVAMRKTVGFRPKLEDLARANFGEGKLGTGSDAVDFWEKGELDKLEKYCLQDVKLTHDVWKKGEEDRLLKYYDKKGFVKEINIDWEKGFLQELENTEQVTLL